MTEIQEKSILVRVSARFDLGRVGVIGSRLYVSHISLFLAVKMKGKFPSLRPFYRKFSQQRNIKCLTEERRKNYQNKQFGVFIVLFISLLYARNPFHSSTFHGITMAIIWDGKIISGTFWGSFAVLGSFAVGDHLRYCTDLMSLMTSSLVTIAITVFKINTKTATGTIQTIHSTW